MSLGDRTTVIRIILALAVCLGVLSSPATATTPKKAAKPSAKQATKKGAVLILCYPDHPKDEKFPFGNKVPDPIVQKWCDNLNEKLSAPDCAVGKVLRLPDNIPAEDGPGGSKGFKSEIRANGLPPDTMVFIIGHGMPGPTHHVGYRKTETVRQEVRSVLSDSRFHIGACFGGNGTGGLFENSSGSALGIEPAHFIPSQSVIKYSVDPSGMDIPTAGLVELLCHPEVAAKADTNKNQVLEPREIRGALCDMFGKETTTEDRVFESDRGEDGLVDALSQIKLHFDEKAKLTALPSKYIISFLDGANHPFETTHFLPEGFDFKTYDRQWPNFCPNTAHFAYAHDCKVTKVLQRASIRLSYDQPCARVHSANDALGKPEFANVHAVINSLTLPVPRDDSNDLTAH